MSRKKSHLEADFEPDAMSTDEDGPTETDTPVEAPAKPSTAFDPKTGEHRAVLDHEEVVHGRIKHKDFHDEGAPTD